ncbi:MAG: hypothetical protein HY553_13675, partial [Elusimicrobia bacterium]|nr:hypothetical protein [Elusimicrobiota bacterium]
MIGPLLAAGLALLSVGVGYAQTAPGLVGFQGRLTDASNNPMNGNQDLTFRIFDAAGGGNLLWSETQFGVPVANGVLAVQLGAAVPISSNVFQGAAAYLEVQVGATVLAPRERLVSVPYAINSRMLEGREFAAFVST